MHPEFDALWKAVGLAAEAIHREDKIRTLQKEIRSCLERRCGNCNHWMKSTCKPEKIGKQFKHRNSFACGDFSQCPISADIAAKKQQELDALLTPTAAAVSAASTTEETRE